jgi:hypothetical protein
MFEGSGWIQVDQPELVDSPPIKVNPFKLYHVTTCPFETVIRTQQTLFTFVEGRLRSIHARTLPT